MKTSRCAIYTRKSSEEGLDQSFSSLHAQREACEAYVLSEKHEGWRVLSAKYDDGGFSGGNMQRPGLKKLLGDIAAGKIDTGRQAACRSGLRQADSKPALVLGGATPTFYLPLMPCPSLTLPAPSVPRSCIFPFLYRNAWE
jgi:hypothetical protein